MNERPVIFSAPMVRAILAGTKTQTRRVAKFDADAGLNLAFTGLSAQRFGESWCLLSRGEGGAWQERSKPLRCPYGLEGERLWVRENFYQFGGPIEYAADGEPSFARKLSSSMFMPRWASRITLELTDVRAQRLSDISEADAIAEGLPVQVGGGLGAGHGFKWDGIGYHGAGQSKRWGATYHTPRHAHTKDRRCSCNVGGPTPAQCAYRELWGSINAKRAPWASNPWVWALSFRRVEQDAVPMDRAA